MEDRLSTSSCLSFVFLWRGVSEDRTTSHNAAGRLLKHKFDGFHEIFGDIGRFAFLHSCSDSAEPVFVFEKGAQEQSSVDDGNFGDFAEARYNSD